jgi:hypothetical protein
VPLTHMSGGHPPVYHVVQCAWLMVTVHLILVTKSTCDRITKRLQVVELRVNVGPIPSV